MENIFNLLRYPITIEFRTEDLEQIPMHVLREWWVWARNTNRVYSGVPIMPAWISSYLNSRGGARTASQTRQELFQKLKQMILEVEHEHI